MQNSEEKNAQHAVCNHSHTNKTKPNHTFLRVKKTTFLYKREKLPRIAALYVFENSAETHPLIHMQCLSIVKNKKMQTFFCNVRIEPENSM